MSPLNTAPSSGAYQHTDPGEWPGVCIARNSVPATLSVSPSCDRAKVLVRVGHSPQHVVAGVKQHRRVERLAELGCDGTWSLWPCVHTTATTLRPRRPSRSAPRRARRRRPRPRRRRRRPRCCCRLPNCRRRVRTFRGLPPARWGPLQHHDRAQYLAGVHLVECLLDIVEPMRSDTNCSSGNRPCR